MSLPDLEWLQWLPISSMYNLQVVCWTSRDLVLAYCPAASLNTPSFIHDFCYSDFLWDPYRPSLFLHRSFTYLRLSPAMLYIHSLCHPSALTIDGIPSLRSFMTISILIGPVHLPHQHSCLHRPFTFLLELNEPIILYLFTYLFMYYPPGCKLYEVYVAHLISFSLDSQSLVLVQRWQLEAVQWLLTEWTDKTVNEYVNQWLNMKGGTLWSSVQTRHVYCQVNDGLVTHQSIY